MHKQVDLMKDEWEKAYKLNVFNVTILILLKKAYVRWWSIWAAAVAQRN